MLSTFTHATPSTSPRVKEYEAITEASEKTAEYQKIPRTSDLSAGINLNPNVCQSVITDLLETIETSDAGVTAPSRK